MDIFDVDYATGLIRFETRQRSLSAAWACNAQPENAIILGDKGGVKLEGSNIVLLTEWTITRDIKLDYDARRWLLRTKIVEQQIKMKSLQANRESL